MNFQRKIFLVLEMGKEENSLERKLALRMRDQVVKPVCEEFGFLCLANYEKAKEFAINSLMLINKLLSTNDHSTIIVKYFHRALPIVFNILGYCELLQSNWSMAKTNTERLKAFPTKSSYRRVNDKNIHSAIKQG